MCAGFPPAPPFWKKVRCQGAIPEWVKSGCRHTPPHGQPLCTTAWLRTCTPVRVFPQLPCYRSRHRTYASPHIRPRSNAAPSTIPLYSRTTRNILRDYPIIIEKQRPWRCTTKPTYVLFKSVEDPPRPTRSPPAPPTRVALRDARASSVVLPFPARPCALPSASSAPSEQERVEREREREPEQEREQRPQSESGGESFISRGALPR